MATPSNKILNDLMARETGYPFLFDVVADSHRDTLKALAAAGYSVVRLDVADLAAIIRTVNTVDPHPLDDPDLIAEAIINALTKET